MLLPLPLSSLSSSLLSWGQKTTGQQLSLPPGASGLPRGCSGWPRWVTQSGCQAASSQVVLLWEGWTPCKIFGIIKGSSDWRSREQTLAALVLRWPQVPGKAGRQGWVRRADLAPRDKENQLAVKSAYPHQAAMWSFGNRVQGCYSWRHKDFFGSGRECWV